MAKPTTDQLLQAFEAGKEAGKREFSVAHGIHQEPTGWSYPSQEHHDPGEHKQYDPSNAPLYNDGSGNVVPWDQRPEGFDVSQVTPAALDALKAGTQKGLSSREIRDLLKPHTKPDQYGHPTGSLRGV